MPNNNPVQSPPPQDNNVNNSDPAGTLNNSSPVTSNEPLTADPIQSNTTPVTPPMQPLTNMPGESSSFQNPSVLNPTSASSNQSNSNPSADSTIPQTNINDTVVTTTTSSHVPQKYGGKKIIATIFSVLFIVGAVAAGVTLVQRQQLLEQEASSGSECNQSPDCVLVESNANSGSRTVARNIIYVDITDQEPHRYNPGSNDDGCRRVNISGNTVTWERYGSGNTCKEISNIQIWMGNVLSSPTPTILPTVTLTPTPIVNISATLTPTLPPNVSATVTTIPSPNPTNPPGVTASCNQVIAYDSNNNALTTAELSQLNSGSTVIFAVSGQTNSGSFSKARFSVNGSTIGESSDQNSNGEYYIEYEIPANVSSFSVKGEVFHSSLGWI